MTIQFPRSMLESVPVDSLKGYEKQGGNVLLLPSVAIQTLLCLVLDIWHLSMKGFMTER